LKSNSPTYAHHKRLFVAFVHVNAKKTEILMVLSMSRRY